MYRIKLIFVILVFLLFAILDATLTNHIRIYDVKPDLFLIGVLFFALYGGLKAGASSGFVAGLVRDVFTGGPFGINVLFFTLAGCFFGYNFSKFYRESPTAQFILSFSMAMVYLLFYYVFLKFMRDAKDTFFIDIGVWKSVGIPFSLYTALVAPLLFLLLRKTFLLRR